MAVRDWTGLYKTGIMTHYVIRDVDRGTPIVQRDIECRMSETLDELTEMAHEQEHELVVQGTAMAITKLWEKKGQVNCLVYSERYIPSNS